ncbi:hypothetical protein LSAT2_021698 [Lamellibrachia satsuma]|nr:hypothetical protein LSAT2_021698 [Lamellibrachia satsuma]
MPLHHSMALQEWLHCVPAKVVNSSLVAIQTRIKEEHFATTNDGTDKARDRTCVAPYRIKIVPQATMPQLTGLVEKCPPATRNRTEDRLVLGKPRSFWSSHVPLQRNTM